MPFARVFCDIVATGGRAAVIIGDTFAGDAAPASAPPDRRLLLDELRARGVRLTAQRRAVVEALQDAPEHLDAAALLARARLREPNLDRATVYRTLDLLKRLRLIDELELLHLNGERHCYEAKTSRDHIHLACFECGRTEELSSALFEKLKDEIGGLTGFLVRAVRLEVGGRCRVCACQKATRTE